MITLKVEKMKIYLASSWRNTYQPAVLAQLRDVGFEVYDFRNPGPGKTGFAWRQCAEGPIDDADKMRTVLAHPVAVAGFKLDFDAMKWADVLVLLLPCGRSAHLEAGWAAGAGKPVVVLAPELPEPELMYKCFEDESIDEAARSTPIFKTLEEVIDWLESK